MASDRVDFEAVKRNAAAQGIDLQEIIIKYDNLTADELSELKNHQEVTHELTGASVLAKFPARGEPLFPNKATSVHYLGA